MIRSMLPHLGALYWSRLMTHYAFHELLDCVLYNHSHSVAEKIRLAGSLGSGQDAQHFLENAALVTELAVETNDWKTLYWRALYVLSTILAGSESENEYLLKYCIPVPFGWILPAISAGYEQARLVYGEHEQLISIPTPEEQKLYDSIRASSESMVNLANAGEPAAILHLASFATSCSDSVYWTIVSQFIGQDYRVSADLSIQTDRRARYQLMSCVYEMRQALYTGADLEKEWCLTELVRPYLGVYPISSILKPVKRFTCCDLTRYILTEYEETNQAARRAMDTWSVWAIRTGTVVQDVRLMIMKLVWRERYLWLPAEVC